MDRRTEIVTTAERVGRVKARNLNARAATPLVALVAAATFAASIHTGVPHPGVSGFTPRPLVVDLALAALTQDTPLAKRLLSKLNDGWFAPIIVVQPGGGSPP